MLEVQPLWRTETGVVHRGLCPSGWLRSTVASFSQGVHKMHANLLAWNSILHIILVYKVVVTFLRVPLDPKPDSTPELLAQILRPMHIH